MEGVVWLWGVALSKIYKFLIVKNMLKAIFNVKI